MRSSAQAIAAPLTKSLIFLVATALVLVMISYELGQRFGIGETRQYSAVFKDTSGLLPGNTVRIAGVKVGTVRDVEVHNNTEGLVTFDVDASRPIPRSALVRIRYLNLTGDRYVDIQHGEGDQTPLAEGQTIPVTQTSPALDLDVLLAGFNPLFEGLPPDQINSLASEIVQVFQGQSGTIDSLISRTASLTRTLADRDAVIGRTVDNLNAVLGTLDQRSPELEKTIDQLQKLTSGLAGDRKQIGESFEQTNRLVGSLAELLDKVRDPLIGTVDQVRRVSETLNKGEADIDKTLALLPGFYLRIGRFGAHGPTYSVYICQLRLKVTGPNGQPLYTPPIGPTQNAKRCSFGVDPLETPELREEKARTGKGDPYATDPEVAAGRSGKNEQNGPTR